MWLLVIKYITCTLREKISDFRYEFQTQTQLNWWFKVQKRLSHGQYYEAVLYWGALRSVQSLSHVWLFVIPRTIALQASLSITNSQSPPKPMSTELVMPSNHLILSSPSPPSLNLSQHQGLFKSISSSHQVAKVLEFQLQHKSFQWTPRTDLL